MALYCSPTPRAAYRASELRSPGEALPRTQGGATLDCEIDESERERHRHLAVSERHFANLPLQARRALLGVLQADVFAPTSCRQFHRRHEHGMGNMLAA